MLANYTVVGYIRVSDTSQVEGHSLAAQERLIREMCDNQGWQLVKVYREEGRSAHVDSISKRPVFRELLDDAPTGRFMGVVVHSFDRWSRNAKIALDSIAVLGRNNVQLHSITDQLDGSSAQGRLLITVLAGFAEFFSDSLATHVKKGISERAHQGRHLGGLVFGYQSCYVDGQLQCDEEHPGGVTRYPKKRRPSESCSDGIHRVTSTCRSWLSGSTAHHRISEPEIGTSCLVSTATLLPSQGCSPYPQFVGSCTTISTLVKSVTRRNSSPAPTNHWSRRSCSIRSSSPSHVSRGAVRLSHPRPEREYLLKGLIRCAHCLMPMWAQTYKNGRRYYREQKGSRGAGYCVGRAARCPATYLTTRCGA